VSGTFPFSSAVVVGGGGAVGGLFARLLLEGGAGSVALVDLRAPACPPPHPVAIEDDVTRPSGATLDRVGSCDLLVLATPEEVALQAVDALLPRMMRGALLVDTLSVKSRIARALGAAPGASAGPELLGVNPMFAPGLGFAGRSVIAVAYAGGGPRATAFLDLVARQGAEVTRLSAEEHDRACAALQVATHAAVLTFGMALGASGYDVARAERIMPPPHRTMLALLGRILAGEPEVYRDVQAANPYAAEMRARLRDAHERLDAIVRAGRAEPFGQLVDELRGVFSGAGVDYARLATHLFELGSRPPAV
jgi:prephenate dehydrogenase